jgi:hypothetical protein
MAVQIDLEKIAKSFLGDRAWSVDLVLRVGAELAQAVNKFPSLSGQEKSELVCQTILKMLEDGEKAEKERGGESTGTTNSTIPWEACKTVVKTLLPATLDLIVSAARGKFDLQKAQAVVVGCLPFLFSLCSSVKAEKPQLTLRNPPTTTQSQSNAVPERPKESAIQAAKEVVHEPVHSPSNAIVSENAESHP